MTKLDIEVAEDCILDLLTAISEDNTREGLKETPKRYVKFLNEFLNPEPFNFTTFKGEGYNEMVIVKDIPFYSLCEHHIAPFFGSAAIAYIPNDTICGISKLPRALEMFARRLQNQERITMQVADYIMDQLNPKGVGVVISARHLCMEMRGVKKAGAQTTTSAVRGNFVEAEVRAEFLSLIK